MTAAPANTYYTAEDLLSMPDAGRFELWDGELRERRVGSESNWIASATNAEMQTFVRTRKLGVVFTAELSLQIVPGRPNRIPRVDGAFVANGRLPGNRPPKGHLTVAPDLVLEVVSPRDIAEDLTAKTQLLLDCGVRLIWIVDPGSRSAMIYRANGTVALVREDGSLDGEDVLPGFSLPLASVLPEPEPEAD
jgi:Uma2 family endonuclease